MRRPAELDRGAESRRSRPVRPGERDLGVQHVDVRQRGERLGKLRAILAYEGGQPEEEPPFLGRDFRPCQQDAVIEFDHGQGFDEERLARPGPVLDDPGQPRVKIRPYRNDEAVVARRDVGVGHYVAGGLRAQNLGQAPFDILTQTVQPAPPGTQRRARRVSQVPVFVEAASQRCRELRQRRQSRRIPPQRIGVRGLLSEKAGQPLSRFHHTQHVDEVPPFHCRAVQTGPVQRWSDVGKGPDRQRAAPLGQAEAFPRASAVVLHQPLVRLRAKRQTGGLSRGRHRMIGEKSEQGVELQSVQVAVAHTTFRRAASASITSPAGKTSNRRMGVSTALGTRFC